MGWTLLPWALERYTLNMPEQHDTITEKYLDKHRHLPQFKKLEANGRQVKVRWCKLCGRRVEAGEEFRNHMNKHQ